MADGDSRRRLQVEIVAGAGVRAPGLAAWLQSAAPVRARGEVTVAIVSDARIRALNRQYRKNDVPTDVLSFPAFAPAAPRRGKPGRTSRSGSPGEPDGFAPRRTRGANAVSGFSRTSHLGDIVIAAGVARRQAREAGHSLGTELRVLALHGLLHLLGYDHEHDDGEMARLERRLRLKAGLRVGLIERGAAGPQPRRAR
jgi:probable rRNA maturation factor